LTAPASLDQLLVFQVNLTAEALIVRQRRSILILPVCDGWGEDLP
jgi:hypothetical protein